MELYFHNRLRISQNDINILRELPKGKGVILTVNHSDETDFKVCLVLASLCRRQFLFMANSEAFEEAHGWAGWWLQRLGAFSVERGGDNAQAKQYAIDCVKKGEQVLVVFPEGEIYYLNDLVQEFKSGAVEIGLKAIIEKEKESPGWTTFIVPIAFKYRYSHSIVSILNKKIERMERVVARRMRSSEMRLRLEQIMAALLDREDKIHQIKCDSDQLLGLSERLKSTRQSVLSELEEKYGHQGNQKEIVDRVWRLRSYLRDLLKSGWSMTVEDKAILREDLATLTRIAQMGSWKPGYIELDPSQERLAETVLKLERDVFRIKRPHQIAQREVSVHIGVPIDLKQYESAYLNDPHCTRHQIAESLRDITQKMIGA